MKYTDYLTPGERMQLYREAAVEKLAEEGVSVTEFNEMIKSSQDVGSVLKGILQTAVFFGVPLGLAAHAIGLSATRDDVDTRKLRATLEHYRDVRQELSNNLSPTRARDVSSVMPRSSVVPGAGATEAKEDSNRGDASSRSGEKADGKYLDW